MRRFAVPSLVALVALLLGAFTPTDGTSWLRAGVMFSLWVIATTAVTVFMATALVASPEATSGS